MTKIDIFSGFLGAGKTTLIQKLIREAYTGEQLVLIENEFGEIGIDGAFLQEAGIEITEMNSGCICCSLVGDFEKALHKVLDRFRPDRILIEPSGVGKLSDVKRAISGVLSDTVRLNGAVAVVDAKKAKVYHRNFGEFFNDQIQSCECIVLSRTADIGEEKLHAALTLLREQNPNATIITTPWDRLTGKDILSAMERKDTLAAALTELEAETVCPTCGHVHEHPHEHHHEHDHECGCHEHHHEHDHECGCHEHPHEHDHECGCHEHPHDHDHECGCHEHPHEHDHACGCHEHHHHHHADEVFTTWGKETVHRFTEEGLNTILSALSDTERFGTVLRAKGVVSGEDGRWLHFDYVPEEISVRFGAASVIGRFCVIGAKLNEAELSALFEG